MYFYNTHFSTRQALLLVALLGNAAVSARPIASQTNDLARRIIPAEQARNDGDQHARLLARAEGQNTDSIVKRAYTQVCPKIDGKQQCHFIQTSENPDKGLNAGASLPPRAEGVTEEAVACVGGDKNKCKPNGGEEKVITVVKRGTDLYWRCQYGDEGACEAYGGE